MNDLRRIVLDVLKPHDPSLLEFTDHVSGAESVAAATASLIELDKEVQNVKLTVEGDALDYNAVESAVDDLGGTVHSIDHVACGEYVAEDRRTPQDR
ncbi:DUF211 domain-containing protein [Halolamina litorea]|jgi:hypothetical protein|uniref:DUF211 domain-containing protein n=1 Tax=Halolamina litorea TaxID=1515593 RepID=A0ABD6BUR9_9EURY|nr:DUF211 domain-containing protein [Halolamina litorea]